MNWNELFSLETPLPELLLRGTVLYFFILAGFRLMPRRTGGELEPMDLIFVLLIAEAAAHAMGDYTSLTDGMILIGILMAWNFLVNLLSYHFPFFENLVTAPAVQVIKDGRLLRRQMRKEYLTEKELMDHLRQEGIEHLSEVKAAYVEGEGHITVLKK